MPFLCVLHHKQTHNTFHLSLHRNSLNSLYNISLWFQIIYFSCPFCQIIRFLKVGTVYLKMFFNSVLISFLTGIIELRVQPFCYLAPIFESWWHENGNVLTQIYRGCQLLTFYVFFGKYNFFVESIVTFLKVLLNLILQILVEHYLRANAYYKLLIIRIWFLKIRSQFLIWIAVDWYGKDLFLLLIYVP